MDAAAHYKLECPLCFDDATYAFVVAPLAGKLQVTSTASTWDVHDDDLQLLWLSGHELRTAEFWLEQ